MRCQESQYYNQMFQTRKKNNKMKLPQHPINIHPMSHKHMQKRDTSFSLTKMYIDVLTRDGGKTSDNGGHQCMYS
jgi:hypothetical protein